MKNNEGHEQPKNITKDDKISRKTVKYDKRSRNFAKYPETP